VATYRYQSRSGLSIVDNPLLFPPARADLAALSSAKPWLQSVRNAQIEKVHFKSHSKGCIRQPDRKQARMAVVDVLTGREKER